MGVRSSKSVCPTSSLLLPNGKRVTDVFASIGRLVGSPQEAHFSSSHFITSMNADEKRGELLIAQSNGTVTVMRIRDAEVIRRYGGELGSATSVQAIALDPDGKFVIGGCSDATVRLWRRDNGMCVRMLRQKTTVRVLAISRDGKILFVGCDDGEVSAWLLKHGSKEVGNKIATFAPIQRSAVTCIQLLPEISHFLAGYQDGSCRVWDMGYRPNCEIVLSPQRDNTSSRLHTDPNSPVVLVKAFVSRDSDGLYVVNVHRDSILRIWAVKNVGAMNCEGSCIARRKLMPHSEKTLAKRTIRSAMVTGCIFSPEGATLYVGNAHEGKCASVWQVRLSKAKNPVVKRKRILKGVGVQSFISVRKFVFTAGLRNGIIQARRARHLRWDRERDESNYVTQRLPPPRPNLADLQEIIEGGGHPLRRTQTTSETTVQSNGEPRAPVTAPRKQSQFFISQMTGFGSSAPFDGSTTSEDVPGVAGQVTAVSEREGNSFANVQARDVCSMSDASSDVPPSFLCPITLEVMRDPVILIADGLSYERVALDTWLKRRASSPSTNDDIDLSNVGYVSNTALKNAIEAWQMTTLSRHSSNNSSNNSVFLQM